MKEVESLMKLRKYEEALRKLENAMLLCDNSLQFISPSEEKISKLKSEDLKGIPIQWRILRGEILLMNNDYDEAMKVAEIILNSPGNSKNSEAYALKTKLIYITGKSNIENAVRHLRRSLEYYNKNEKAKLLINKIKEIDEQKKLINDNYFKKKNFEEAIKQYDILIEECTNLYLTGTVLIILLRNKSTCLMELKRYTESVDCTSKALFILKRIIFKKDEPSSNKIYEDCKQKILFKELYKKRSESLIKIEKFEDAKKDIEILMVLEPYDETILSVNKKNKGNNEFKNGNYELSKSYYTEAIELYKENYKCYFNRGLANMKLYCYNSAIDDFKDAYRFDNKYYKAVINIAKCYLQLFKPDNAIEELSKIHIDSNNEYYGEYNEELETAKKIKGVNSNFMGNTDYDQILNIYREKQDYKYVEVIILEKMAINTSNKELRIQYCTEAINNLDKLLKITIHNYDNINNSHRSIYEKLYKSRAECYMESKSYHKAVNDYEILVKLKNNNNLYVSNPYCLLLNRAKRYIKDTEDAENYKKKGNELYKNKNYEDAINFYTKAIDKCPHCNSKYYTNRAAAYMMTLNYKEAIKDCITAINNDKQSILGYIRLATCYLQLNEPNQAIIYIKKGLSSCILNEKLEELKKMLNKAENLSELKEKTEETNYIYENYEMKISNYKLLLKKYKEYCITGYIEILIYKEIAKLYKKMKNYNKSIMNVNRSINILNQFVLKDKKEYIMNEYKKSIFKEYFIELLKIRAECFLEGKFFDDAVKDYTLLNDFCPYDYERERTRSFNSKSPNKSECYRILGLDESNNPTLANIKKAYRNLARKFHPDKCQNENQKEEYTEKMKEINIAYEVLLKYKN
ncbi:TPR-like protein [Neocallimastix sp. 'constans']